MDWVKRYGPPWMTWLVAALLVQRERQRWHHAVTREDDELGSDGGEALPGWRVERHGIGVALTAPDGEFLDVDFNDETGAVIDVWFFADRVKSVSSSARWVAERRLWRWRPGREVIVDGCEALVACGAARFATAYKNQIVLVDELDARAAATAAELGAPDGAERRTREGVAMGMPARAVLGTPTRAALGTPEVLGAPDGAGRWLAALEPGGEAAHVDDHRAWLRAQVGSSTRGAYFLEAVLTDAEPREVAALARPVVERLDGQTGHAIEVLRRRGDVSMGDEIARVLARASLGEAPPLAIYQACAYLFERGADSVLLIERFVAWARLDVVTGFRGNPWQAAFAVLALRHVPAHALALVRASLRSATPICVQEMVGVLDALDQRWGHRELAAALGASYRDSRTYRMSRSAAILRASAAVAPTETAGPADARRRFEALIAELRAKFPDDWDGAWPVAR